MWDFCTSVMCSSLWWLHQPEGALPRLKSMRASSQERREGKEDRIAQPWKWPRSNGLERIRLTHPEEERDALMT